jgi:hypothetical protein
MDHTHDIKHVCKIWSQALPERPQSCDDGICGPLVAHLLFGVEDHVIAEGSDPPIWRKQVVPRCGDNRGVEGQRADDFCHDIACAHYECTRRVKDFRWPITEFTARRGQGVGVTSQYGDHLALQVLGSIKQSVARR